MAVSPPPENDIRRLIGLILIVVATLLLTLTGLCCAIVFFAYLGRGLRSDFGALFAVAIPLKLIGASILYAIGRWLRPK